MQRRHGHRIISQDAAADDDRDEGDDDDDDDCGESVGDNDCDRGDEVEVVDVTSVMTSYAKATRRHESDFCASQRRRQLESRAAAYS
jgi:hypothetical protein